jgi:nicotinamide-nucleotide amidase
VAVRIVRRLAARDETVACAESLTGGLLCSALVDVPGASVVVRGGVVAYATDVKASVLGVDADLLRRRGAVDAEVAAQLAVGVRRVLGAHWGISTTGVAGPDPAEGHPVGTAFIAVLGPSAVVPMVEELHLHGTRRQIRVATVAAALDLMDRVSR